MPANERQAEAWNGPESAHFVDHADRDDRQLESPTIVLGGGGNLDDAAVWVVTAQA